MKRRLFTILSAVSLLLCAATCVLWLRSYYTTDGWSRDRHWKVYSVWSSRGAVAYEIETNWPGSLDLASGNYEQPAYHRVLLGFWSSAGRGGKLVETGEGYIHTSTYCRVWGLPYWFLAVSTGLASIVSVNWLITRSRGTRRSGLCVTCGYDLRTTPGRCPECGAVSQNVGARS